MSKDIKNHNCLQLSNLTISPRGAIKVTKPQKSTVILYRYISSKLIETIRIIKGKEYINTWDLTSETEVYIALESFKDHKGLHLIFASIVFEVDFSKYYFRKCLSRLNRQARHSISQSNQYSPRF